MRLVVVGNVGVVGAFEDHLAAAFLHRYGPDTAEDAKTTAAAPNVIADDVLELASQR